MENTNLPKIQKTLNQDYIQSGLKMDYLNLSQTQIRSHLQ